jgi:hypothetical protein
VLQVMVEDGQTSCAEAVRLVRTFHQQIRGKQPAGSDKPVRAAVDGWTCVSGPPSSQGGTLCMRGSDTVSAAVVDAE